jgi:cellulose biosynthesis protein BcsQ
MEDMDLILCDIPDGLNIKGKNILLTEKRSQIDKNYEEHVYHLYKYSNVRSLAAELLFIYSNVTGRKAVPIRNSNAKIVVFGTPEGGSGCTSCAVAFAQNARRFHGKKVIYISLEEIESTMEYMKKDSTGKSISEYLYYLFNSDDDQHFPFMESYTVSDRYGVDGFTPSPGRNVLNSLNKEEMQYFVSAVLDTGGYDLMVIDAANNLGKSALTCYEMANNICMVENENALPYKKERFMEYFTFVRGERILNRMAKVINCFTQEKYENDNMLRVVCCLPEDKEAFSVYDGVREIKAEGPYGESISNLVNSVIKNIIC